MFRFGGGLLARHQRGIRDRGSVSGKCHEIAEQGIAVENTSFYVGSECNRSIGNQSTR